MPAGPVASPPWAADTWPVDAWEAGSWGAVQAAIITGLDFRGLFTFGPAIADMATPGISLASVFGLEMDAAVTQTQAMIAASGLSLLSVTTPTRGAITSRLTLSGLSVNGLALTGVGTS